MLSRTQTTALASLGALLLTATARADLIATVDIINAGGGLGGVHTEMAFLIQMDSEPGDPRLGDTLFFDTDDDGAVVSFTSLVDPEFDDLVAVITNGVLDTLSFRRLMGFSAGGSVGTEGFWFYGDNTGDSGIDLQGYNIDEIRLTVNEITITNDGSSTMTTFDVTWEFFGTEVPAPGAVALLGVGGLLCGRRRRQC